MEPALHLLLYNYLECIHVKYKMAGLLPSWKHFRDNANALSRPIHFGPEWTHARALSGMPIENRLWITDPPTSSFPACIAFKCVEDQSSEIAPVYLRMLREDVMLHSQNIARTEVLTELACKLTQCFIHFDPFTFRQDLVGTRGRDLFRADWQEALYRGIKRLPTFVFTPRAGSSAVLQGYQTYLSLEKTLHAVCPVIQPSMTTNNPEEYAHFWRYTLTEKEMEVYLEACAGHPI